MEALRGDSEEDEQRRPRRGLGPQFGWLWTAYGVSTFGTWVAFDAFPLIAILVLHASPAEVGLLAAVGLAAGAALALPLGPWVEGRSKRPVMIATDLIRFGALVSVPVAFALGRLGFAQLLVVSAVLGAATIAFRAASGACLKAVVPPEDLLAANGRLESTTWTATALGPPLGGAAIGLLGPMTTVVVNAVSFLLSAAGIRAMGATEPRPARAGAGRLRPGDVLDGWRFVLGHPALRPLFFNTVLVNGLIIASAPLVAVLMLGDLGFAPWQYGLAFGAPCVGGLVGARLAPALVARLGKHRVLIAAGTLRAMWPVGLAFIGAGAGGLALVLVVQFGLVTCMGVFNPVFAAHRLAETPSDRVARTLAAWSITSNATIAVMTVGWGLLAGVTSPRVAIAAAGVALLATPLLLPREDRPSRGGAAQPASGAVGCAR